jgi:NADH dehydrogenase
VPHFFGVEGAAENAFPLYSLSQGIALRSHILRCFERAVQDADVTKRQRMLTFAIVGGGPTGGEFAGALAELIHGPLGKDYPDLDPGEVRIVLLEALDSLLSFLPQKLPTYTLARLRKIGVDVRLEAVVNQITPQSVHLKDGTVIPTETVAWTAGVRGDPRVQDWGLPTGRGGRVQVLPTLQVPEHPEVYVVGDLAYLEKDGSPLPMVAWVAKGQGKAAAHNIARQITGQELKPYRYRDLGSMVTIGRNAGVARLRNQAFTGLLAWVAWLTVHLITLIGFRNRLMVLLSWAWDYFFFERAARLILPQDVVSPVAEEAEQAL